MGSHSYKVVSQHIQDCFVYFAITDGDFLRMVRTAIQSNWFSSQVTKDIIDLCYVYYDTFQEGSKLLEPPTNHIYDELVRFLDGADEATKGNYFKYLKRIQSMSESPPVRKYVIQSFSKFAQARELETSLIEAHPYVERGNFDKARQIVQKGCRAGITSEDVGIEYPGNWPPTYWSNTGFREVICPIGIDIIDRGIQGIKRTQLVCIFAGYKVGKTWGVIQIAREALMCGRKVLEISHELGAEEVEMRHDQMIGSLLNTKYPEEVEYPEYDGRVGHEGEKIDTHTILRDTVFNEDAVKAVREKIARWGGRAILKKYPMGSCSIGEIERYLDYLESFHHFIPDLIINDYVEKMRLSTGGEGRDAINETYINLKRIADERCIAVVTASQIKTKYLESSTISDAGAAAEDARKLGNIDLGLFFGMSRAQSRSNLMQAFVLVNRSGPQKFGCVVARNLKVGQLSADCWPLRFNEDE